MAAKTTAPMFTSMQASCLSAGLGGRWHGVGGRRHGATDHLGRTGLDADLAARVDAHRKAVHRPRRRTLNDLAVAVVDRAVARALEPTVIGEGLVAGARWPRHGGVAVGPRHGAPEVRALPVQGEEPFGDAGDVKLAFANDLDVAELE